MTTRFIVCDACYILDDTSYQTQMMPLWFPPNQNVFVKDFCKYGGDILMKDIHQNPIKLIRSTSTKHGDCSIDGLGCDAGNFSLFETETFTDERKHMFRFFDTENQASEFLSDIISRS